MSDKSKEGGGLAMRIGIGTLARFCLALVLAAGCDESFDGSSGRPAAGGTSTAGNSTGGGGSSGAGSGGISGSGGRGPIPGTPECFGDSGCCANGSLSIRTKFSCQIVEVVCERGCTDGECASGQTIAEVSNLLCFGNGGGQAGEGGAAGAGGASEGGAAGQDG
jgi:hypothetical protein